MRIPCMVLVTMVLAACAEPAEEVEVGTEAVANAPAAPACSNGVDDDGDGRVDFPADWECDSYADPSEGGDQWSPISHECGSTWWTSEDERSRVLTVTIYSADDTEADRLNALRLCGHNSKLEAQVHRCRDVCDATGECKLSMDLTGITDILPCECKLEIRDNPWRRYFWECKRTALLPPRAQMSCGACTAPPPHPVRQE